MPEDEEMVPSEVAVFGDQVAEALTRALGTEPVGVYFVGSLALGGYIAGESDIDIAAVSREALTGRRRQELGSAVVQVSAACPTRGPELTLYRQEVAASQPAGAEFEVNANGGPRMPTAVHTDATAEPAFWYVLDRAIAHRFGVAITGPPAGTVFTEVSRITLLSALYESMAWHRTREKATLYSVLNPCRAWRSAAVDVLGSKLEGAAWARTQRADAGLIDAAVALRRGQEATLDEAAVDAFLGDVAARLRDAMDANEPDET
jgi:hypothetical protein